jgi:hypothetical protein
MIMCVCDDGSMWWFDDVRMWVSWSFECLIV